MQIVHALYIVSCILCYLLYVGIFLGDAFYISDDLAGEPFFAAVTLKVSILGLM